MKIRARAISKGVGEGPLLISDKPISFLGDVDPRTGIIINKENPLYGKKITGKVLAFPCGVGSTVGSYVMYQMRKNGTAPAAIINESAETIIIVGAIISNIPLVDSVRITELKGFKYAVVNAYEGWIEVT
ncbi:MAG: hypothetical protein DRN30_01225 [Thermoplasmata archaeon]|nr:DUF126 domain-containing protein [Euryarchaeota archaeon]RLF66920.1 MAG: hypothetical protein DRN30_01225 [Thermoplasmata archaeon]